MRTLFETDRLILEHSYETVQLRDKVADKILFSDEFYGDPDCGLIEKNERWAIVAGNRVLVWTPGRVSEVVAKIPGSVHAIRQKGGDETIVEILVDPWSDAAAIWEMDTTSLEAKWMRDFNDYRDRPYTDSVVW